MTSRVFGGVLTVNCLHRRATAVVAANSLAVLLMMSVSAPAGAGVVGHGASPATHAATSHEATSARPPINWKIARIPKGWFFRTGVSNATKQKAVAPLARAEATLHASANPNCSACAPPLLFTPNDYVMGGLSGTPGVTTITPVYWAPSGYSFPGTYESVIDKYLSDVAAASKSTSNVFAVAEEYYQQIGTGPKQYIQYQVTANAQISDADSYPTSGCPLSTGFTECITDAQLQSELSTLASSDGLTVDDSHIYMVFFPPNVETCFDSAGSQCSTNVYCGYHSAFSSGTSPLIYANMPYPPLNGCGDPWDGPQAPNGNAYADAMISIVSHEYNEAITDWDGAWLDSAGYEIGDECAYVYGNPVGGSLS
ncbi:MAG TPA: hypothetical protein VKU92_01115, partial [Acidimicrobiales bacterium]|nr:hypothetical protein [Acidimicrobiales bacterium]